MRSTASSRTGCRLRFDFGLRDGDADAICGRLQERAIPFILHSGYTHGPDAWRGTIVPKPADPTTLVETVIGLLNKPDGLHAESSQRHLHRNVRATFRPNARRNLRRIWADVASEFSTEADAIEEAGFAWRPLSLNSPKTVSSGVTRSSARPVGSFARHGPATATSKLRDESECRRRRMYYEGATALRRNRHLRFGVLR